MKKIAYFICFLYASVLSPINIDVGEIEKNEDNLIVNLNIDMDESQMVCRDDILISVDDSDVVVDDFQVINYSQEEIVLPKKKKKVYGSPFSIKIFLVGDFNNLDFVDVYFSCFVINEDEKFEPFEKIISVDLGSEVVSLKNFPKKVSQKFKTKVRNAYANIKQPAKRVGSVIFDARILTLFLIGILFISFILFSVLSIEDLLIVLSIFLWGYFSKFIFVKEISLFFLAILFLISSVWFFINYDYRKSLLQKSTRLLLGFLCASLVLPIFLEVYLSRCFTNYCLRKETSIKRTLSK